jgi:hypothetical protein
MLKLKLKMSKKPKVTAISPAVIGEIKYHKPERLTGKITFFNIVVKAPPNSPFNTYTLADIYVELSKNTKYLLYKICKGLELNGNMNMKKAELLKIVTENLKFPPLPA